MVDESALHCPRRPTLDDPLDGSIHDDLNCLFDSTTTVSSMSSSGEGQNVPGGGSNNSQPRDTASKPTACHHSMTLQKATSSRLFLSNGSPRPPATKSLLPEESTDASGDILDPSLINALFGNQLEDEAASGPSSKRLKQTASGGLLLRTNSSNSDFGGSNSFDRLLQSDLFRFDFVARTEPEKPPCPKKLAQLSASSTLRKRKRTEMSSYYSHPLHQAVKQEDQSTHIEKIIQDDPSALTVRNGRRQETPLAVLLRTNHQEKLKLVEYMLAKSPMTAAIPDRHDNTPLHIILSSPADSEQSKDQIAVVQRLLATYPYALELANFHGKTPLELCQHRGVACSDEVSQLVWTETNQQRLRRGGPEIE